MKIFLGIGGVVVIVASLFFINQQESTAVQVFKTHIDGSSSDVVISCSVDSDCVLEESLVTPCGGFVAIAKNNTELSVNKWNDKQSELLEDYDIDCMIPPLIDDFVPVCTDTICAYEERDNVIAD